MTANARFKQIFGAHCARVSQTFKTTMAPPLQVIAGPLAQSETCSGSSGI